MARAALISAFWALVILQSAFARAETQKISTVSVVGVVFCDQCLEHKVTKSSVFLKGASVALDCKSQKGNTTSHTVVATTDEKGSFKAELPASFYDSEGQITCSAQLKSSPRSSCNELGISTKKSSEFVLRSKQADKVIYNAGALSFVPKAAATFCSEASYYTPYEKPAYYKPPMKKPPPKPPMKKPPPMEKPPLKPPMKKPPPMEKPPLEKPPTYSEPKFEFPKFKFPKFKDPFPKDDYPKYKFPPIP